MQIVKFEHTKIRINSCCTVNLQDLLAHGTSSDRHAHKRMPQTHHGMLVVSIVELNLCCLKRNVTHQRVKRFQVLRVMYSPFEFPRFFFLYLNFYFKNRSTKKPKEPNFGVPSTLNVKSTQLFLTKNLILGRRTRFLWVRLGRTRTRIWFLGSRTSPQGSRTHATQINSYKLKYQCIYKLTNDFNSNVFIHEWF